MNLIFWGIVIGFAFVWLVWLLIRFVLWVVAAGGELARVARDNRRATLVCVISAAIWAGPLIAVWIWQAV